MDSAMLERFEAIVRTALAEDATPEMSMVIEAVVVAMRAAETKRDIKKLMIFLSHLAGQAAREGIRATHPNAVQCEGCATRHLTDFAAGLGYMTTGPDDEDDEIGGARLSLETPSVH